MTEMKELMSLVVVVMISYLKEKIELVLLDGVLSEEDELLGLGDIEEIVSGVDVDDLLFDLCAITMSAVLVVSKPAPTMH